MTLPAAASPGPFPYERARHEEVVRAWRRDRLARLKAPGGWLSLVARVPLEDGAALRVGAEDDCDVSLPAGRAPALVGTIRRAGREVSFTPAPGCAPVLRGATGERTLVPEVATALLTDREGPGDRIALGDVTVEVTEQATGMFVRARDPANPARDALVGIEHFPIDPRWRVVARLERYEPAKPVDLGYLGGAAGRYLSPGVAVFEVDGVPCRIDPVLDESGGRLYVVFWDPTARDATYGAGRFLYAPLPEGDRVLLDFNQAFSPPCAFTPHAACPLAPAQNRLPIRVEAGERRPR